MNDRTTKKKEEERHADLFFIHTKKKALRCLKNKPGTVNPPDMTIMTRKTALNNVELVYVKSDVPFMASVFIVKRTPVATLIATLKREHILPKEETLAQCK